jgi:hypothetical protein
MTDLSEAVSEKDKIMVITKIVLNLMKQNAARVHRLLKVITFQAKGVWRQCYELSKQLQDLHIDVAFLSQTHLKPHESFFVLNYHFYQLTTSQKEKAELSLQLEKAFPTTM